MTNISGSQNEAGNLEQALRSALALSSQPVEVLVVDGQSSDGSTTIAQSLGAKVLSCAPSRSRQMNLGAEMASGDILLFLHADCTLPMRYAEAIQRARSDCRKNCMWGAFETIRLDAGVRFRARVFHMPYGDQGIFVERQTFRELGGFKEMPLLEDVDLVCRLRKLGPPALVRQPITTSARRWQRLGFLQTTIINQGILIGWRLGVDPQVLANWYHRAGHRSKGR